jgi:hypothetical protein
MQTPVTVTDVFTQRPPNACAVHASGTPEGDAKGAVQDKKEW